MSLILDKIPLGIIIFDHAQEILVLNNLAAGYIEKTGGYMLDIIRKMVSGVLLNGESDRNIIRCSDHHSMSVWSVKADVSEGLLPQILVYIQDETLNYRLEAAVLKSEKLAMVGHLAIGSLMEMRNPLTSARGFCQLIENGDKIKKDYISIIARELEQIQQIIETYVIMSEISQAKCFNSIYYKFWTCIQNQVNTYKLIMINEFDDDQFIDIIPEEQIAAMIELIKTLNIWGEGNTYIIRFEIHEESRCLKLNVCTPEGTNRDSEAINIDLKNIC